MVSIIVAVKVAAFNEDLLRIWHDRTELGPADHPLLQPDPACWRVTHLTEADAKAIDVRNIGQAAVRHLRPPRPNQGTMKARTGNRDGPSIQRSASSHSAKTTSWRWRESNPRPMTVNQDFSGRSLLRFSRPQRSSKHAADRPSRLKVPAAPTTNAASKLSR